MCLAVLIGLVVAWRALPRTIAAELRVAPVTMPAHAPITAAWRDEERIVTVGQKGEVFERRDGTWRAIPSDTDVALSAVIGSPSRLVAVGRDGTVIACSREACQRISRHVIEHLYAVAADGDRFVAVGEGGVMMLVEPGASAATRIDTETSSDLRAVAMRCESNGCRVVAAADDGVLVDGVLRDGAWTWSPVIKVTNYAVVRVWIDKDGPFVLAEDGVRFHKDGDEWRALLTEEKGIRLPVHVVTEKGFDRTEQVAEANVRFGPVTYARRVDSSTEFGITLPTRIPSPVRPVMGDSSHLLGGGDLYRVE